MSKEDKNIRIVEINGIKVEVDLRTAKRVDTYKVGDHVKVLKKGYGDDYRVHHGVITGFDEFKELPTITVMYVENYSGDFTFAALNTKTKDIEIVPADDEMKLSKTDVLAKIDEKVRKAEFEVQELKAKRAYFLEKFGALCAPENVQ